MFNRDSFSLQDKTILITGAGSGIGAACAKAFHDQGAHIVLVDVDAHRINRLVEELGSTRTLALEANVIDRERLKSVVQESVDRFGGIDMVFANAAIVYDPPTTFFRMEEKDFEHIIEVNLMGIVHTVRACLPQIIARKGHVLVSASMCAFINGMANISYAISKVGVEMFGRSLRAELAGTGVTAGVVYSGWVRTPLSKSALGGHPTTTRLVKFGYPGPFRKPITLERVTQAVLKGVKKRAPRIIVPRRWIPVAALRGILNPISEWIIDRHGHMQELVRQLENPPDTIPPSND